VARHVRPQQYMAGQGWRTCRTKILDNALIGFCKAELGADSPDEGTGVPPGLSEKRATVLSACPLAQIAAGPRSKGRTGLPASAKRIHLRSE
jgi:hypothetical protein